MASLASALQIGERVLTAVPCSATSLTEMEAPLAPIPENEQNIRLDDADEEFPADAETIRHIGPVECKMLLGADKKHYLLEVARLTPLDANYVKKANGGTGNYSDEMLGQFDSSMFVIYTLRQELVHLYRIEHTKSAIMKALSDASGKETAEKDGSAAAVPNDIIAAPAVNLEGEEPVAASTAALVPSSPAADLKKTPEAEDGAESVASAAAAAAMKAIEINPNVFIDLCGGVSADKSEQVLADEELTRKMSDFLWSKVIPTITEDIRVMNQIIVDGDALTKYMHEYGINLRYLGRVAEVARSQEATDEDLKKDGKIRINPMPKYWLELLEMEMIARAMKHIVIQCIRANAGRYLNATAGLLADLLSFLLGSTSTADAVLPSLEEVRKATSKKKKSKKPSSTNTAANDWDESEATSEHTSATLPDMTSAAPFSREQFWQLLRDRIKTYFGGDLSLLTTSTVGNEKITSLSARLPRLPLLRRVCQQLGISVSATEYDFTVQNPFVIADIQAVFPKAKMPTTDIIPYVDDIRQRALRYAEKGHIGNASALFQQASILLEQISGSQCREMCVLNEDFAKMLLQSNQLETALAVMERNLISAMRVSGLDSPMTLHQHMILGQIYTELQMFDESWKHLSSAAYLAMVISGKAHPEVSNILMSMADVATRAGDFASGLVYLAEIRERFERGGDVIKLAYINQNMAELHEATNNLAEAKSFQNAAYQLFRQVFGESDPRAVDSKEKYAHLLRSNHSQQMNLLQQRQSEETAKKEAERLRWLEDDEDGTVKTAPKKKKSSKKSKK